MPSIEPKLFRLDVTCSCTLPCGLVPEVLYFTAKLTVDVLLDESARKPADPLLLIFAAGFDVIDPGTALQTVTCVSCHAGVGLL